MPQSTGARVEPLIDPVTTEQFQDLLGGCARALAGNSNVNLIFGMDGQKFSPAAARLAHRASQSSQRERTILRGQADLVGVYQAFHTQAVQRRLMSLCAGSDPILSMAEQARIEAIGSRRYAGVAANLAVMIDSYYLQEERIVAAEDTLQRRGLAIAAMLREVLAPVLAPRRRFMLVEAWRLQIQPSIVARAARLEQALHDQFAFGLLVQEIVATLPPLLHAPLSPSGAAQRPTPKSDPDPGSIDRNMRSEGQAEGLKLVTEEADGSESLYGAAEKTDVPNLEIDAASRTMPHDDVSQPARRTRADAGPPTDGYRVFTRAFDETILARNLAARLPRPESENHDEEIIDLRRMITRLAARLERRLLALQPRAWDRDVEDGLLDPTRLVRAVVNPGARRYFRRARLEPMRDTVVTLLLDNSASMRGRPTRIMRLSVEILTAVLLRVGVGVEVLGFTTRAWRGGRAREAWIRAGCPPAPGRLNELLHIIYKAADSSGRNLAQDMKLMAAPGLAKENIDGEALEWAYGRLLRRGEQRRILFVISDGAPADDGTLSVSNSVGNVLETHLRRVAREITLRGKVELLAVGIGYDVGKIYPNSIRIDDVHVLGEVLMTQLYDRLAPSDGRRTAAAAVGVR
jgi:cobaltochelatase CobT